MIAHHFRNVNEFRRWKVFYIEQQYTRSFSVEFIHQFLFWCGFAWNVSIFLFEMIPYIFLCAVLLILCSDKILLIISRRYTKIGWLIFSSPFCDFLENGSRSDFVPTTRKNIDICFHFWTMTWNINHQHYCTNSTVANHTKMIEPIGGKCTRV